MLNSPTITSKPGTVKPKKIRPAIWLPKIFNLEFFMPTAKKHTLSDDLSHALINLYNCSFTPGEWLDSFSSWLLKEHFYYVEESLLSEAIKQGLREVRRLSSNNFVLETPVDHLERALAYTVGKENWRKELGWLIAKVKDKATTNGVDDRLLTSIASLSEKEKISLLKLVKR